MVTVKPWIAYNVIRLEPPVLFIENLKTSDYLSLEGDWGLIVYSVMSGVETAVQAGARVAALHGVESGQIMTRLEALLRDFEAKDVLTYDKR
jgi:hypothetical protein